MIDLPRRRQRRFLSGKREGLSSSLIKTKSLEVPFTFEHSYYIESFVIGITIKNIKE